MSVKTRFAPSPTGLLHVGNIRTALISYLFSKANNGEFYLRIDDTDLVRSKEEYSESIKEDLKWLGIDWNKTFKQSDRYEAYSKAMKKLIEQKRLYPCFETPQEIEIKRKIRLSRGLPPIYDRESLKLTKEQIEEKIKSGLKPHYRFKLEESKIEWDDLIRGKVSFDGRNLSDPILIREDQTMTYILCSVVDDIDFDISHIIRGEDHVTNTAISMQITQALGGKEPVFAHLSLLKSKDSQMSKRTGGFDIKNIREDFIEPISLLSYMAKLGSNKSIEIKRNMNELIKEFDIRGFSKSAAIYDPLELERLNHKFLTNAKFKDLGDLKERIGVDVDEDFWLSVRANINKIVDLIDWWRICKEEITPAILDEDREYLKLILTLLPEGELDNSSWDIWTNKIKNSTDKKGKELYMPIRKALTGKESGPEMRLILPLIPYEKVIARLKGQKS